MSLQVRSERNTDGRRGSILLETAFVVPLLIAAGLFLYYLAYVYVVYNCVSDAMYRTGNFFAKYALLYHENVVEKMDNSLSDQIYGSVEQVLGEGDRALLQNNFAAVRNLLLYGDDVLYRFAADTVFKYYFERNPVYDKLPEGIDWDFGQSAFYNGNEEFFLHGEFSIPVRIPFCEWLISGFSFEKTLGCRAFLEGNMPAYATAAQNGNIWALSNFQRGEAVQSLYGRNLPPFFPDVDFYRDGTVGTIRSIDHTKKYYTDQNAFRNVLCKLVSQLHDFNGASYGETVIDPVSIRTRELILVFPENDFSAGQQAVINELTLRCNRMGVGLKIERYQRSE